MANLTKLWIAFAAAAMLISGRASAITTNFVDESTTSFKFDYTSLAPPGQTTEATPGDIVLCDGPCDTQNPVISDVIQFRPGNDLLDVFMTVTMFSDNSDTDPGGNPAADVGFANVQLSSNVRFFEETTFPDGSNGFFWAPLTNDDPGFVGTVTSGPNSITFTPIFNYSILSDPAPVPEPSTLALLAAAIAGFAFWRRRKPV
jgi:hypothetical protein